MLQKISQKLLNIKKKFLKQDQNQQSELIRNNKAKNTPDSFIYINSDKTLAPLLSSITPDKIIAFDTEADSLHHYYQKICLIQISIGNDNYIIDPLANINLKPLFSKLNHCMLIIHGADYDLRMLKSTFGYHHKSAVFDTMLAAKMLGKPKLGFQALTEQYFNVDLPKSTQRSDWSKRPLSDKQLEYAANDTKYLLPLFENLKTELEKTNRMSWHKQACESLIKNALEESENNSKDNAESWRIKGYARLNRKQLACLRELWNWREHEAKKADLPPFKVMSSQQLIGLSMWTAHPKNNTAEKLDRLPKDCQGKRLENLDKAIKKASNLPEDKWPLKFRPSPKKDWAKEDPALVELMRNEGEKIAKQNNIDTNTLVTRAALSYISKKKPSNLNYLVKKGLLMQWQAELLNQPFQKILKDYKPDQK